MFDHNMWKRINLKCWTHHKIVLGRIWQEYDLVDADYLYFLVLSGENPQVEGLKSYLGILETFS